MGSVYMRVGEPASNLVMLALPHLPEPISLAKAVRAHPQLLELDGTARENTLLYFYRPVAAKDEYGALTGVTLEFLDADAEEDMADLLGVTVGEFAHEKDEEEAEDGDEKSALSEAQRAAFRADIAGIRAGLAAIGAMPPVVGGADSGAPSSSPSPPATPAVPAGPMRCELLRAKEND